ncbi:MAG: type II secretion system F family protein [Actinobacteria bacterium HGW-Actinobacteria-10]|nr:MAG: type II secretion system F family protein [Actinobacteria bacterium HGW-Actinobacteria-10]
MPSFNYSVRDKTGKVVKGKVEGDSKDAVSAKLREMGYIILDVNQVGGLAALNQIKIGGGSVKIKDVSIFARQFATMINAGLSLTKCLTILAQQTESASLKDIIQQLARDVESGQSLSDAMIKHPKAFPPIFINMVRAGETGGVLDEVLLRVADHFENELALKAKVKSAMTYPVTMGGLVLVVVGAMMIFVVPTFEGMFRDMGNADLPGITQALVNASHFVASIRGVIAAVIITAIVYALKALINTEKGRFTWDTIKLKMPVAGSIIQKMAVARFTRTFGTLVSAGVPILSALDIVADTAGNTVVAKAVKGTASAIKEGETIAKPLSESPVFPSMVVQMIAVGEETGALDSMLVKIAEFYDEEVATAVDGLTSVIEPIMMATLGVIVGGMVVALYLPMFTIVALVQ